jgi:hypothetical protein
MREKDERCPCCDELRTACTCRTQIEATIGQEQGEQAEEVRG